LVVKSICNRQNRCLLAQVSVKIEDRDKHESNICKNLYWCVSFTLDLITSSRRLFSLMSIWKHISDESEIEKKRYNMENDKYFNHSRVYGRQYLMLYYQTKPIQIYREFHDVTKIIRNYQLASHDEVLKFLGLFKFLI